MFEWNMEEKNPTFHCELRGFNIAGNKATAKKSVKGKQKLSLDEDKEVNVDNLF